MSQLTHKQKRLLERIFFCALVGTVEGMVVAALLLAYLGTSGLVVVCLLGMASAALAGKRGGGTMTGVMAFAVSAGVFAILLDAGSKAGPGSVIWIAIGGLAGGLIVHEVMFGGWIGCLLGLLGGLLGSSLAGVLLSCLLPGLPVVGLLAGSMTGGAVCALIVKNRRLIRIWGEKD